MSLLKDLWKERSIKIFVLSLFVLGVLPLGLKGLQFGMDFTGGTLIQVKLEKKLDPLEMQTVLNVLQARLNAYGLKDISVKPAGQEYIIVAIAETNPQAVNQLQSLLGQQGKFETLFNGEVVLSGNDIISVITDPQKGYGVRGVTGNYEWIVPFLLTNDAANRFAQAVAGQCTLLPGGEQCQEVVYMFIDRPDNAVILMNTSLYNLEKTIPEDLDSSPTKITIEDLVKNSAEELIVTDTLDNDTLSKIQNRTVVVAEGSFDQKLLEKYAAKVISKPQSGKYWIVNGLNLENIVHLTPGITAGNPITSPSITGHALDVQQAVQELNRVTILLKSGKLPVSVSVGSVSTISAALGADFLKYSAIAGGVAGLAIIGIVLIRYRNLKIAAPIILTSFSEVFLILGTASLIGWQIDLVSVAGILAAVGTGIDYQIIIIDEILRKEQEAVLSTVAKIKKAFSIIFMAAATIIFAMFPLIFLGLGTLKGFAITTILGVLIGLFITRPAYASIVNKLSTKQEP
jgi:preprotein translocase subunit SecD